jgi:hypothetical protein
MFCKGLPEILFRLDPLAKAPGADERLSVGADELERQAGAPPQFLRRAQPNHGHLASNPCVRQRPERGRTGHALLRQGLLVGAADAPDVPDGNAPKQLFQLRLLRADVRTHPPSGSLAGFRVFVGHLRERLRGANANTDRHADLATHFSAEPVGEALEVLPV